MKIICSFRPNLFVYFIFIAPLRIDAALHGGHVPFHLSLSVSCSALHLIYSQSKAPGGVLHCREEWPSGYVGGPLPGRG